MNRYLFSAVLAIVLQAGILHAQLGKISIAAGTPEDQALQTINTEQDAQKRLAMYQDFLQKFSANPAAVAYGNWQVAQSYQSSNDPAKAMEYGDKALAAAPDNLDILVMQTNLAQQLKDNTKVMDYSERGAKVYHAAFPEAKGSAHLDEANKTLEDGSYEFLEAAAFNTIADVTEAKTRAAYIDRFNAAFPDSKFSADITSYDMVALSQLNDTPRLIAFAEKTLATNPDNLTALLLLSSAYADDPKPGSVAKAVTYSQKTIAAAKADASDADRMRKVSAGAAHSTLGYAYMKQDKTAAAVPELKAATVLLKGQDEQSYAVALYRLGYAYAKLNRINDARETLMEAVRISGPVQAPAQDLLTKVNVARSKTK